MSDTYLKSAFFAACEDAVPASSHYVSLYVEIPFYGGPEEGGWWGRDVELVAHKEVKTDAEAEAIRAQVEKLARELSEQARDTFNRACAEQCEWLEARGLDADYLPEVDGEERYIVRVEQRPGENEYHSSRYYE